MNTQELQDKIRLAHQAVYELSQLAVPKLSKPPLSKQEIIVHNLCTYMLGDLKMMANQLGYFNLFDTKPKTEE